MHLYTIRKVQSTYFNHIQKGAKGILNSSVVVVYSKMNMLVPSKEKDQWKLGLKHKLIGKLVKDKQNLTWKFMLFSLHVKASLILQHWSYWIRILKRKFKTEFSKWKICPPQDFLKNICSHRNCSQFFFWREEIYFQELWAKVNNTDLLNNISFCFIKLKQ